MLTSIPPSNKISLRNPVVRHRRRQASELRPNKQKQRERLSAGKKEQGEMWGRVGCSKEMTAANDRWNHDGGVAVDRDQQGRKRKPFSPRGKPIAGPTSGVTLHSSYHCLLARTPSPTAWWWQRVSNGMDFLRRGGEWDVDSALPSVAWFFSCRGASCLVHDADAVVVILLFDSSSSFFFCNNLG